MFEKLKHPVVVLFLKFAGLYLLWFLFYNVWLRSPAELPAGEETRIETTSAMDNWVIQRTTSAAVGVLQIMGHEVFYDGNRTLGIKGTGGLWVGDSCNAVTLIALFSGLIICLTGIWWHKLVYIIIGSMCIWILNVIRLVALSILSLHSNELMEFNHTYTFTILIYAFIIFLWYWWIKKYADLKRK